MSAGSTVSWSHPQASWPGFEAWAPVAPAEAAAPIASGAESTGPHRRGLRALSDSQITQGVLRATIDDGFGRVLGHVLRGQQVDRLRASAGRQEDMCFWAVVDGRNGWLGMGWMCAE